MAQNITRGIKALLEQANQNVQTMDVEEAKRRISDPAYQFIDLRDVRELQRSGKIPGAFHAPRGMLEFWIDPDSPYHKDVFNQDKTYVFYCASAWRSALSAQVAQEMGLAPVMHLGGGFTRWAEDCGEIEKLPQR